MTKVMSLYSRILGEAAEMLESLKWLEPDLERACDILATSFRNGGKLLICGNGGSAADSSHLSTEWVCRFQADRRPFPAISLTADGSLLSAIGNDYAFEEIYARQVKALGLPGDILIVFSTSGNSKTVLRALEVANESGLQSIGFLGKDGGKAKGLATVDLLVAVENGARVQEGHKILIHALCAMVEELLVD